MATPKRSLVQSPFFKIAAGILLTTVLVLVFLPQLSSNSWFSGKIKQAINEKVPGKLDYTHLTLSWLNGLQISGLVYDDKTKGTRFTVEEISTSKGLLSLAANYKDAGVIQIKKPQAIVYTSQPGAEGTTSKDVATQTKKTPSSDNIAKEKVAEKEVKPEQELLLPPIHVQLNISDGSLLTISDNNAKKTVLENLNLDLNLDVPNGAVDYQLSFQDEKGAGSIHGEGNLVLPKNKALDISGLESNAVLQIQNWQIADLLTVAASQANGPEGEGIINGVLRISGTGDHTLGITGNLTGADIQLHGGPLNSDTPTMKNIALAVNLQQKAEILTIEKLELQSPFISGSLAGATRNNQIQTLSASAKIDAAAIFSQFPNSLHLKKDIQVSEGVIDINADLSTAESSTNFKANAHLQRLAGSTGKKKISWKKPVDITVVGHMAGDTPALDQLTIESSFLQAKGSEDDKAIQLAVAADIGTALKELEQFIDLGGWNSGGKLDLNLNISNSKRDIRDISGDLKLADFTLNHKGAVISPADTLTAALSSTVHLSPEMTATEFTNSKLDLTSWLGKATVTAERFTPERDDAEALLKKAAVQGTFSLDRITTLLQSLQILPEEQSLAGSMDLSATVTGEQLQKPAVSLKADMSPFTYTDGEKSLTDTQVSLAIEATADLLKKNFDIKKFTLKSSPVAVTANATMLAQNREQVVSAKGTTTLDFKVLSEQLKSFADSELVMSGVSEKPFVLEASSTEGLWNNTVQHAQFSTSLHADKITGYGLDIESFDLPIRLRESIAEIDLTATVNRGEMKVKPKIDFSGDSPVVSLAENSTILKAVGLTGEMSNDLLAKVHPLFKGVASTAGTINLDMQYLNWPTDKKRQKEARFAGAFTFNDVKLQAGSLLTPLLAIMKVEDNEIVISDQPVTFVGENERVTCSPLEATVHEYSLILEGSVGFDQSLDYIAKIPVTRKMVSGDVYKYLDGTFITVPLTGTVSKPSVSKSFVQKALGDLVLQAGKKQLGDQAGKLLQKLFQ